MCRWKFGSHAHLMVQVLNFPVKLLRGKSHHVRDSVIRAGVREKGSLSFWVSLEQTYTENFKNGCTLNV